MQWNLLQFKIEITKSCNWNNFKIILQINHFKKQVDFSISIFTTNQRSRRKITRQSILLPTNPIFSPSLNRIEERKRRKKILLKNKFDLAFLLTTTLTPPILPKRNEINWVTSNGIEVVFHVDFLFLSFSIYICVNLGLCGFLFPCLNLFAIRDGIKYLSVLHKTCVYKIQRTTTTT